MELSDHVAQKVTDYLGLDLTLIWIYCPDCGLMKAEETNFCPQCGSTSDGEIL